MTLLRSKSSGGQALREDHGLLIDLFAGGGGASSGIWRATGRHPDVAVNHDPEAIALHAVNHPSTLHLQDDIRKVDIGAVLEGFPGRTVDLLWASPDCKHHSKARGGKPKDKNIRGLAWEVLRWSAAIRRATGALPRVIALENVEEFQDWGPLHRAGRKAGTAMKGRRGETFRLWVGQLEKLGFRVDWRELVAADYGAPTTRKRLFLQARSDGLEIAWPEKTHAPLRSGESFGGLFDRELQPYRSAASIIDWDRPIPSIFGRRQPLKPKTQQRIAKGIRRYVIDAARPFIVPITHTKGFNAARSADDPLRTITTAKGGEFAVSAPSLEPMRLGGASIGVGGRAGQSPPRGLDQAVNTVTAKADRAVAACFMSKMAQNGVGVPMSDPLHTAMAGAPKHAPVAAFLKPRYGEREGQAPRALDVARPLPTVVPGGNGGDLVTAAMAPVITTNAYGDDRPGAGLRAWPAAGPLRTVTSSGGDCVMTAYLGRQFGSTVSGRDLEDPHPAVMTGGAGGKSQIVAAHLSRQFGKSVGSSADSPVGTIVAGGGGKTQVVAPFLSPFRASDRGRSLELPLPTVTANGFVKRAGCGVPVGGLAAPILDKYYGAGVAADAAGPLDTVTARDRFGLGAAFLEQANTGMVGHTPERPVSTILGKGANQRLVGAALDATDAPEGSARAAVLAFLWAHFGEPTAEERADPTGTAMARLRFGLVVLEGVVWQIVDIGMRMLTPRELFRAQGFADDYVIDLTFEGRPLTKTAQTRMAGNSVCPDVAHAILRVALDFEGLAKRTAEPARTAGAA